jgi:hypothetical protein
VEGRHGRLPSTSFAGHRRMQHLNFPNFNEENER